MAKFIEKGVLSKAGMYVQLNEQYQEDEEQILQMLEEMNRFRSTQQIGDALALNDSNKALLRRSMLARFPFMAKL